MSRLLLILLLLASSALAESDLPFPILPGEPPPLKGELAEHPEEHSNRRSGVNVSFDQGGEYYAGGVDGTIGVSPSTAILATLGLARLGPDDTVLEIAPGVDTFLSDSIEWRFNVQVRRMSTSYGPPDTDFVATGVATSFDWSLGSTTLTLGGGLTRYFQPVAGDFFNTDSVITQASLSLGVGQEIGDWLRLAAGFTTYGYAGFPTLRTSTQRQRELISGFPARALSATIAVRPFSAGAFALRFFRSPSEIAPLQSVSRGISLTFQERTHWTVGVSVSVITAKGGSPQTSRGLQVGYLW